MNWKSLILNEVKTFVRVSQLAGGGGGVLYFGCPLCGRKKHKQGDNTFTFFSLVIIIVSRILPFPSHSSAFNSTFGSRNWCRTSWLQCPRCRCSTPSTCSWTLPSPWRCSQRSGRWSGSCTGCPASGGLPACTRNHINFTLFQNIVNISWQLEWSRIVLDWSLVHRPIVHGWVTLTWFYSIRHETLRSVNRGQSCPQTDSG